MSKKAEPKISIPGVTKKEKNKRAKYLYKRINFLFSDIADWIKDLEDYRLKISNFIIEGEKLPEAEIFSGKKLVVSLKPAGLWSFGTNCRIDISSGKDNNIIFDVAKESDSPDWILVSSQPGKEPKKVTKIIFRNLLKKIT